MSRAVRVLHEKIKTAQGLVVELKVWRVPKSEGYPEGIKYSFFAVFGKQVLVGYDNHKPKGVIGILKEKNLFTSLLLSRNFVRIFKGI